MHTPEELERLKKIRSEMSDKVKDFILKEAETVLLANPQPEGAPPTDEQMASIIGLSMGAWISDQHLKQTFSPAIWAMINEMAEGAISLELDAVLGTLIQSGSGGMKN